jgi:hypothetical protein
LLEMKTMKQIPVQDNYEHSKENTQEKNGTKFDCSFL